MSDTEARQSTADLDESVDLEILKEQAESVGVVIDVEGLAEEPQSFGQQAWERFRHHRAAMIGAAMLLLLILAFAIGPIFSPYDFKEINVLERSQGPSFKHPFGTDDIGRDLMVRTLRGGRISLIIALVMAAISTILGTLFGALAGYFGSAADAVVSWVINLFMSIPLLAVLLVFGVKLGSSPLQTALLLAMFGWVGTARIVRSQFIQYKNMEFVQAAKASGASAWRIIFRHILPNTLGPILVAATLATGVAIILESTLSFLSLGVRPPTPTLGNLVAEAKGDVVSDPFKLLIPGGFITLIVLSVNFLGDGLRDALDPTTRTEG